MRAKRALIVDDSKSARLFLSRILVQHAIEVETVESAELAIDYLKDHRPDVIFMDHQMPGMDGLQAVKIIKNNPVSATIPIMMYTSQEGELYLGQARALGAVGVMPKQIRQADVSKVLYELHLLPDRRSREPSSMRPVSLDALAADAAVAADQPIESHAPGLSEAALNDQLGELRRAVVACIESQSDRIVASMHAALNDDAPLAERAVPARPKPNPWPIAIAAAALLLALLSTMMWWREANLRQGLATQLAGATGQVTSTPLPAADQKSPAKVAAASSTPAGKPTVDNLSGDKPVVVPVPYGENPLGAARLTTMRQLFQRLASQKFRGVVDVRSFPGRFCLVGNADDGYSLAPDETPYSRCDAVGNPEATDFAQREPLQFANMAGELRNSTKGAAEVRVRAGDALTMLVPYPEVTQALTAGEWNRAAGMNNRVEIRLR